MNKLDVFYAILEQQQKRADQKREPKHVLFVELMRHLRCSYQDLHFLVMELAKDGKIMIERTINDLYIMPAPE